MTDVGRGSMVGRALGRYRIVERLGEGGMGTVYRAEDPRLERDVAIKVVRDDALRDEAAMRRFRQEARALSRLVHPNIATLFDFDSDAGVDFLVLEFVPGETLAQALTAGPLPEPRARAIAVEVASALEAAHEQGVVHRDLKPGNVVITPRGRAKVLDFGLARLAPGSDATAMSTVGLDQDLLGTVHYMAPEQIRRGQVDPRADVYALGVMLYEMVAGALPFAGKDMVSTMYAIVHEPAPRLGEARPGVTREFQAIVARCLAKDPAQRFASARALTMALRGETSGRQPAADVESAGDGGARLAAPASPPFEPRSDPVSVELPESGGVRIRSLAVLPLENRSGDAAQEFFTDGMTDALIADLAQIGALRVISRTSAMRYKGAAKPLPEIARELSVDAIVEGSVLRAGDRVRITAQLVDAADRSLWARSYERDITDILALQSDVARAIAEGIRVQITPEEAVRLSPKGPVNPVAHVAYLQGRYLWNRWTPEALRESLLRYQEALAADPGYGLAWAGLADSFNTLGNIGAMPPGEAYPKAREAAKRGLEIDPTLAEPHTSLGYVARFHDWDWPAAEREFLRAIQLNPGYATARRWYAQFLSGMARHEEAISEAERALELDPLSLILYTAVGDVLFYARRYDRALQYYSKCVEMDPQFGPGHSDLARVLDHVGRHEEAIQEMLIGTHTSGGPPALSTGLATLMYRGGRRDEAEAMMAKLLAASKERYISPYGVGSYYTVTGDHARALDWLERAYDQRDGTLVWIKVHPRLDPLRGEPRFRELLSRMKLD